MSIGMVMSLASVAGASSESRVLRLFEAGASVDPGGRPAVARAAATHFPLGDHRNVFLRGIRLSEGETVRRELPSHGSFERVRWMEHGESDDARIAVAVDGRVIPPEGDPAGWRSAVLPGDGGVLTLRATGGDVRLAEPFLEPRDAEKDERPDLLLVTVDTLRRDALPVYGGRAEVGDGLLGLAKEAVVFDDAVTPSTWTIPAFVGLFTGRHPMGLGELGREARIPETAPTLAEELAAAGYHTHAVAQNTMLSPDGGFARGFDSFDFYESTRDRRRPAARVTDLALRWLAGAPRSPAFVWVHYFDPHAAYEPLPDDASALSAGGEPSRFDVPSPTDLDRLAEIRADGSLSRRIEDLYLAEVRAVDREITRLVEGWRAAGRLEESVVVITSDHGEELLDHELLGHGHTVYAELVRVPLIVRFPEGRGGGTRIADQVTLLDVGVTLAESAGFSFRPRHVDPAQRYFYGESLRECQEGKGPGERWHLTTATLYPELPRAFCLRDGTRKLLLRGHPDDDPVLAFDRVADPEEEHPTELEGPLRDEVVRLWTNYLAEGEPAPLDPERIEELRALGYLD